MTKISIYSKIRQNISRLCQNNEFLYYSLRRLNRFNMYYLGIIFNLFRSNKMQAISLDVNRILWVNPKNIINCCHTNQNKYFVFGKIMNGNWDLNIEPFDQYNSIYSSLKEFLIDGKPYKNTKYYISSINSINNGEIVSGCRSSKEFDQYINKVKEIFNDIKNNGYKKQEDLNGKLDGIDLNDYVTVDIDRNGHFLFTDGQHRLTIAKLLGITQIPVRVATRHSQWINFRKKILDISEESGGKIYQSIPHPDLDDIQAYHTDERWEIISSNLPFAQGKVLDIGAHWGYFCHQFEEIGFSPYAVENDPVHLYFLNKIKIANSDKFNIISTSIFNLKEDMGFDIVLALNIFHHFLKTKEIFDDFVYLLNHLEMKSMFFEPHCYEEFVGKGYYKNLNENEFLDLITSCSCLKKVNLLGRASDNRPIYRIDA